jgi:hypothetical protein
MQRLSYMISEGLPQEPLSQLTIRLFMNFKDDASGEFLKSLGIEKEHHIRIATEGALVGSLIEHGFNTDMVIVSDGRTVQCYDHAFVGAAGVHQ